MLSVRFTPAAWNVVGLPVLGAVALVFAETLRRYVATLAVLSLLAATGLRAAQIHQYVDAHLANRPPAAAQGRQVVFIEPDLDRFSQDLVQNDPFLRNDVWIMLGRGPQHNRELMRLRFPGARRVVQDRRGEVWEL